MRRDDADVFKILEEQGIDLSTMDILSPYAKKGEYRTAEYARRAKHLTAWEIDPNNFKGLIKNLPSNTIAKLCDSCEEIYKETWKYDFVIVDPYFGDSKYTEGFCLFPGIYRILKPHAYILSVVLLDPHPYANARGYGVSDKLKLGRKLFYGTKSEIVTEQEVEDAYARHAAENGYKVIANTWSWSFSNTCFYLQELVEKE